LSRKEPKNGLGDVLVSRKDKKIEEEDDKYKPKKKNKNKNVNKTV
jgi:hypothetical protein